MKEKKEVFVPTKTTIEVKKNLCLIVVDYNRIDPRDAVLFG